MDCCGDFGLVFDVCPQPGFPLLCPGRPLPTDAYPMLWRTTLMALVVVLLAQQRWTPVVQQKHPNGAKSRHVCNTKTQSTHGFTENYWEVEAGHINIKVQILRLLCF